MLTPINPGNFQVFFGHVTRTMLTPVNPGNFQVFYLVSSLASIKGKLLFCDVKSSEIYMWLYTKIPLLGKVIL